MEVYIDGIMLKSLKNNDHLEHLDKIFWISREHKMMINQAKDTFGIPASKFFGFIDTQRWIEACPNYIKTLIDMPSQKNPLGTKIKQKNCRSKLVHLQISKRCEPFFKLLWRNKCLE